MTAHEPTGDSRQESDEEIDDLAAVNEGVANTNIGSVASTFGTVERPHVVDAPTFDVGAVHYADAPNECVVELEIDVDDLRIGATLSPVQARALARQLGEAARFADEGEEPEA
jgi:hypothetical protein